MKKRVLTQILALALVVLTASWSRAATYYVANGGDDTRTPTEASNSATPWLTIANAVALAASGDTILVQSGTYAESVTLNKSLTLMGMGSTRPVVTGNGVANAVFTVSAQQVHISGLQIEVDQAATLYGIATQGSTVGGLMITNNHIYSAANSGGLLCAPFGSMGVYLNNIGTSSYTLAGNVIAPKPVAGSCAFGRAVRVIQGQGVIGGMSMVDSNLLAGSYGVQIGSARGPVVVMNNHTYGIGVQFVGANANSGAHMISNNRLEPGIPYLVASLVEIRDVHRAGSSLAVTNNTLSNYSFYGVLSSRSANVSVANNSFIPRDTTTYVHVGVNTKQLTAGTAASQTPIVNSISIKGNNFGAGTLANAGVGVLFMNHNSTSSFGALTVGGAGSEANTFAAGLGRFIALDTNSGPSVNFPFFSSEGPTSITTMAPVTANVDASENIYGTSVGSSRPAAFTSPAQAFEVSNKIQDGIDWASLGLVTTVPNFAFVTPQSFLSGKTTAGSIQRAVDKVMAGSTVLVAPGTYTENVSLNKAITVLGSDLGKPIVNGDNAQGVFTVSAPNVNIGNFDIRVSQVTAQYGVFANNSNVNNLNITGNHIFSAAAGTGCLQFGTMGIYLNNIGSSQYTVQRNIVRPLTLDNTTCFFGRGIRANGGHGVIGGTSAADSNQFLASYGAQVVGAAGGAVVIENNTLGGIGIQFNSPAANTGNHIIRANRFDPIVPQIVSSLLEIRNVLQAGSSLSVEDNTFSRFAYYGVFSQRSEFVSVKNNTFTPYDTNTFVAVAVNTKQQTAGSAASQTAVVNSISVTGNAFNAAPGYPNAGIGVGFYNYNQVCSYNNVVVGTASEPNDFSSSLGAYVYQDTATSASSRYFPFTGEAAASITQAAPAVVNASLAANNVDGVSISSMNAAQRFTVSDKVVDAVDFGGVGYLALDAATVYVSANAFLPGLTTAPSLNRAFNVAANGNTILHAGNSFAENLSVNKAVTLRNTSGAITALGDARVDISSGNLTLGSSYVTSGLDMRNGLVDLNGNSLTSNGPILGGSASSYVIATLGNLNRANVGAGLTQFPVGTTAGYYPLSITDANNTNDRWSVNLTARSGAGSFVPPLLPSATATVNVQWNITEATPGGSNATITAGWPMGSIIGTFNPSQAYLGTLSSAGWNASEATVGTRTATATTTAAELQGFAVWSENITAGSVYYLADTGSDARSNAQAQVRSTPWATFGNAITNMVNGDTLIVLSGTFNENPVVNKQLTIIGNLDNLTTKPVVNGGSRDAVFEVQAQNVTIQNLQIEINQATTLYGIYSNVGNINNLKVLDNRIVSTLASSLSPLVFGSYGVFLQGVNRSGYTILRNRIERKDNNSAYLGRGVRTQGGWGYVGNVGAADSNSINALYSVQLGDIDGGPAYVLNNKLNLIGVEINHPMANSGGAVVRGNTINSLVGDSIVASIEIKNAYEAGATVVVENNTVREFGNYGILSSHSNQVRVAGNTLVPKFSAVAPRAIGVNTKVQTVATVLPSVTSSLVVVGNDISGNGNGRSIGIEIANHDNGSTVGTNVIGGAGSNANTFRSNVDHFVVLDTFAGPTNIHSLWRNVTSIAHTIASRVNRDQNISQNFFEVSGGVKRPTDMTVAELMEVENKLFHKISFSDLGFITVVPNTAFVGNNSFIAPYTTTASVQRGMDAVNSYTTVGSVVTQSNAYAENLTGRNVQVITASGGPLTVNALTMQNAADTLRLGSRLVLNNALTLTSGLVAAINQDLVLQSALTLTGGNDASYVITSGTNGVQRYNLNNTPAVYPVGVLGAGYYPASVSDANNSNDSVTVRVRPATSPAAFTGGLPGGVNRYVNAEWNITAGSSAAKNATVSLSWPMGAAVNAPFGTGAVVGRYNGTSWEEKVAGIAARTATGSGFSSFSPFAVYDNAAVAGTRYYVDATSGDDSRSNSAATNPNTPWRTITNSTLRTLDGDTVVVFSGNYNELPIITKQTAYIGGVFNAGVVTLAPAAAALAARPVVTGSGDASDSSSVIKVRAQNVTIQGFQIDVNQATTLNGIWTRNSNIDSLQILNNRIIGTATGSTFGLVFASNAIALKGNLANQYVTVKGNLVEPANLTTGQAFGRAIRLEGAHGIIGSRTNPADTNRFIAFYGVDAVSTTGGPLRVWSNSLTGYGVSLGFLGANSGTHEVKYNIVRQGLPQFIAASVEIRENTQPGSSVLVDSNLIVGHSNYGVLSTRSANVFVSNNVFVPADTAVNYTHIGVNTKMRTAAAASTQTPFVNSISIKGNTFATGSNTNGTGIHFANSNANSSFANVEIGGNNAGEANSFNFNLRNFTVLDTASGLSIFNPLFAGAAPNTITQQTPAVVNADISGNNYSVLGGVFTPAVMTNAQRFEVEDKVRHAIDHASLGFLSIVPNTAFVTSNSFIAPLTTAPSYQRGHDAVSANGLIVTNTAVAENLTVTKSVTLTSTLASGAQASGLTMAAAGSALTLGSALNLTDSLTFTAGGGNVLLGNNNLTLQTTRVRGGDADAYAVINGTGRFNFASVGAVTGLVAPIGTTTAYAPITLTDANASGDALSLSVSNAANRFAFNPALPSNALRFPALQWSITGTNAAANNATVSFQWPSASVVNGPLSATNTNIALGNFVGWTPRTTTLGVNTATTTGLANWNSEYAVYSTDLLSGTKYFVDSLIGDNSRSNVQATVRTTPWQTITHAINNTVDGDTIVVLTDGTYGYRENLVVNKQLTLIGNDLTPAIKPVINGLASATVVRVAARNVTLDNFEIRVDQAASTRGIDATATGINNVRILNNRIVTDNSLRSTVGSVFDSYGILLNLGASAQDQFTIARNLIGARTDAAAIFGRGIRTIGGHGLIGGASRADSNQVLAVYSIQVANTAGGNIQIRKNHTFLQGVEINTPGAGNHVISDNVFDAGAPNFTFALAEVKSNVVPGANILLDSNLFRGHVGFGLFSSRSNAVTATNNIFVPADTASTYTHIHVNTKQRTAAVGQPGFTNGISIRGNNFGAAASRFGGAAVAFANHDNAAGANSWGTVTLGTVTQPNLFAQNLRRYIVLDGSTGASNSNSIWTGSPVTIMESANLALNGANNRYAVSGVLELPTAMSRATLFDLEAKFTHAISATGLGLITVTPGTLYVSDSSFVAPATTVPSVQRAVAAASATSTIAIEPTSVAENVSVDKALTWENRDGVSQVTLQGITMNAAGGALTLAAPFAVSNALTLGSGNIVLVNHDLAVGTAATISGGNGTSYVVTPTGVRLVKQGVTNTPVTFAVGTPAAYTPLTFADANNTGDVIGVNVENRAAANNFLPALPSNITSFVNTQYNVTEDVAGGSNATLTFGWNTAINEVNPPLTVNTRVLRLVGSSWLTNVTTYNPVGPNRANASLTTNALGSFAVISDPSPVAINTVILNNRRQPVTQFCEGDSVYVVAVATGTFNSGNLFTAELSDASGAFTTPVILGARAATATDTIKTIIPVGTAQGTAYRIRANSSNPVFTGTQNGDALTIRSIPAQPSITAGGALTFCVGDSVELTAPAGFTSYLWSNGAVSRSIFAKVAGNYTVVVSNGNCASPASAATVVTTTPRADASFTGAPTAAVCVGSGAITLIPTVAGGTFFANNVALAGNVFTPTTAGTFRIAYKVFGQCGDSTFANITVNPLPNATFTGLANALCVGSAAVTITPTTAGGTLFVNGVAQAGLSFNPTTVGTFRVRYSVTTAGCTDTTGVTVTVNPLPNASFTGLAATYCAGAASVTITPTTAGGTLFVNGVAQAGLSFNPATAGSFRVRYSVTTAGCTDTTGVTVTVNPLPNAGFAPSNNNVCVNDPVITLTPNVAGGVFSGTGVTGNTFTPNTSGSFTVTYTITVNGCVNQSQQNIIVNARPDAAFTTNSNTLCVGQTLTITPSVAGGVVLLNNVIQAGNSIVLNTAGTFRLTYSLSNGSCTDSTFRTITVNPRPDASFAFAATDVCAGTTIAPVPTVAGGEFRVNGVTVTGNIVVPSTGTSFVLTYRLTNASGCTDSTSRTIGINPLPNAGFTAPANSCVNLPITFAPAVAGGTFVVNGTAITGNTFTPATAGNYNVVYTVTNAQGCTSSSSTTVVVTNGNFTLTVDRDTINASAGDNVTFTASSDQAGGLFTWTGPAGTFTGATLSLSNVQETADYVVTYNLNGCTQSRTVRVRVNAGIFIPNLFTPNGDGRNDKLFIYGYNVVADGFSFTVFNRYGNEVYKTTNPNDVCFHLNANGGWDGNNLPTDVYNYVIQGKLANGTDLKVEGRNTGSVYLQK